MTGAAVSELENAPIRMGFIGPLSGEAASFGVPEQRAIEIAVSEINDAGGIDGRMVEVIYEDGRCDGKAAATAAQKLLSIDGIKILHTDCSSESMAVAPLAADYDAFAITAYAMNPDITGSGLFRSGYSDAITGERAAEVIRAKHRDVAIIHEQSSYATGLMMAFRESFTARDGVVTVEGYPVGSKDVRTQLTLLLQKKPEAFFIDPDTPSTALAIIQQLRQLGYEGPLYGNFFGSSSAVQESGFAEGMIFFADPEAPAGSEKERLLVEYGRRYGGKPEFSYPFIARYDTMQLLFHAIDEVGDDPAAIKDYLHTMPVYRGILGDYKFDENGDNVYAQPVVLQIVNGEVKVIG